MAFYKNTVTVTVLTETPLMGGVSIEEIARQCDVGDFVMHSDDHTFEEVTGKQMVELLYEAGSEPGFFLLDDDGNLIGD